MIPLGSKRRWNKHFQSRAGQFICLLKRYRQPNDRYGYVVTPAGATPWIPTPPRVDNTLVRAIVRAHRWRDMLESGDYTTVRDLAKAETKTSWHPDSV